MLKMAVFAPIPSASTTTADSVKPGVFSRTRHPCLRSFQKPDIATPNLMRCGESTSRQVHGRCHMRDEWHIRRTQIFDVVTGRNDGRAVRAGEEDVRIRTSP